MMSTATASDTITGEYLPRQVKSYQTPNHAAYSSPQPIKFHDDVNLSPTDLTSTNTISCDVVIDRTADTNHCHAPSNASTMNTTHSPPPAGVNASTSSFSRDNIKLRHSDLHATSISLPLQHQYHRLVSVDERQNQLAHDAIKLLVHAIEQQTAANKNKWGNPAALGLGGFAATTFILSAHNTTLLNPTSLKMLLPMALWFGGAAQLLAGVFEFALGNTFGGTAFVGYGAFWLTYCTLVEFAIPEMVSSGATTWQLDQSIAFYLMVWLIFSFYMMIASFRQSKLLASVFVTLVITFSLLVAGNYAQDANTVKAGGYFGLLCASLAFYGSAAAVINTSFGYSVLPIGAYIPPSKTLE